MIALRNQKGSDMKAVTVLKIPTNTKAQCFAAVAARRHIIFLAGAEG
jgi:hypothetical protein